jgi:ABC-type tungstate transport system substrate-binding protein
MSVDSGMVLGVVQAIMTVVIAIIGWAIKTTLESINRRLSHTENSIEAHSVRLGNVDKEIAVMTERQGHVQMLIAEKLDRINDKIDNQNKLIADLVKVYRPQSSD